MSLWYGSLINHWQPQQIDDDTPKKDKKKGKKGKAKPNAEDSDAYAASAAPSDAESISNPSVATDDFPTLAPAPHQPDTLVEASHVPRTAGAPPLSPILNKPDVFRPPKKLKARVCGLCGTTHDDGACFMTESAENLAEFRNILLSHAGDETIEERVRYLIHNAYVCTDAPCTTQRAAIAIIDETLHKRGKLHLIMGQPLYLVETPTPIETHPPPPALRVQSLPGQANTTKPFMRKALTSTPLAAQVPQKPRPIKGINAVDKPNSMSNPDPPANFGSSLLKPKSTDRKKPRVVTTPRLQHPTSPTPSAPAVKEQRIAPIFGAPLASTSSAPRPKPRPLPRPGLDGGTNGSSMPEKPTKRPPSPLRSAQPPKKVKESKEPRCPICNEAYHLMKDCPVVKKGTNRFVVPIWSINDHC